MNVISLGGNKYCEGVPELGIELFFMFERFCPECNNIIFYKTYQSHWNANKNKSICKKCAAIKSGFLENFSTKGRNTGKENPMYGKKHSEETKIKIRNKDMSKYKTDSFKNKISKLNKGSKNPMYGKNFYDLWVDKYGIEEAKIKLDVLKEKHRKNNSGVKNPMYGKPSPQGSGNGWSGWYNNWYFRSLLELSYLIKIIEPSGKNWESAENIKIPYKDYKGVDRTYSPDFVFDKKLIECKPIKLHNTPLVVLKTKAGENYCKNHDLKYLLTDVEKLSFKEIKELYTTNKIKFLDKYEKKMKELLKNVV
jgi:hypothetical protein